VHLAATGLRHGKDNGVPQVFQHLGDGDASLREQGVVVASDEE